MRFNSTLGIVLAVAALCAATTEAQPPLSEVGRWLQGYLRIDTTNPPGDEHRAASYLADILHRAGISTRLLVTAEGRTSLYAEIEGKRSGEGLLMMHHMDVVPPGPGWTFEPFAGDLEAGKLRGRGAIDVKSLGVAQVAALVALKKSGVPPERGVALLAVADEETGGGQGTAWLWEHHPEIFDGVAAVLNEGGSNRKPPAGLLWWGVETSQKRPLWLRVSAQGRGGHGSGLNPHSAMHKLIRGLSRLVDRPPTYRVTEAARTYLRAIADLESPMFRGHYRDVDAYVLPDGPTGPMLPGVANLFLDTVQVTVIEGSEGINIVPERASALLDVRLLPETDADAFLADLRAALGSGFEVEVLVASPPADSSSTDTRLFRVLTRVLEPEAPVVPALIAGFTDSRFFRERGIPTYGFSPFVLSGPELSGIHGPDEEIPVAELDAGTARLLRVVQEYAYEQ
ncbi:MAG: M20/M25/M40 family metallo-hydrolase [Acidobacteriota bacterium]